MRVLLIEDSERLRQALHTGLEREGFAVDAVGDGPTGLSYAANNPYDVIVLDLMLPGLDGLSLLGSLRAQGCATHVLILSAKDTVADRVRGLRAGADDYLVKPFAFVELVERLRALVRRRYEKKDPTIRLGSLVLEGATGTARVGETEVPLTPREYALLEYMAHRPGETLTRFEIEDAIYDEDTLPRGNALHTAMCRLRAKLDGVEGGPRIDTLRGRGYVLVTPKP